MYKYELHCHENTVNLCGIWSPEELARHYAALGYAGVVLTDHFFTNSSSCRVPKELAWKERVEIFCQGYERTKAAGEKLGLDVFFGFEHTANTFYGEDTDIFGDEAERLVQKDKIYGCDFLILGLGKEWLLSKDEGIFKLSVNDFLKMVKEDGGTVIHAHPFRLESYMDHLSLFPEYTDGVEIYNAKNKTPELNEMAKAYAKNYNLFCSAGTDAHYYSEMLGVVELYERAKTVDDIVKALKNGDCKLSLVKNEMCPDNANEEMLRRLAERKKQSGICK